jgi:hypothetical protein
LLFGLSRLPNLEAARRHAEAAFENSTMYYLFGHITFL